MPTQRVHEIVFIYGCMNAHPAHPTEVSAYQLHVTKKKVTNALMPRALVWQFHQPARLLTRTFSTASRFPMDVTCDTGIRSLADCTGEVIRLTCTSRSYDCPCLYWISMCRLEIGIFSYTTLPHFRSCDWPKFPQTLLCKQHILFLPIISASICNKSVIMIMETVRSLYTEITTGIIIWQRVSLFRGLFTAKVYLIVVQRRNLQSDYQN